MNNFTEDLDDPEWDKILDAIHTVAHEGAKRVDGEGWKVYTVGTVIRIDITKES